jgi:hypothetical protein
MRRHRTDATREATFIERTRTGALANAPKVGRCARTRRQCVSGIRTFRNSWTEYGCFDSQCGHTIIIVAAPPREMEAFSSHARTGIDCWQEWHS